MACKKCDEGFALNGDELCISCSNITEIGGDKCKRCGYNKENNKYECYECKRKKSNYDYSMIEIYTYVTNTFQCFNNTDPEEKSFYGCLTAYYNKETNIYECLKCSSSYSFIPIKNGITASCMGMGCSNPSSSMALHISGLMPSSSNVIYYLLSIIYYL
jgi:hypothetical protein